ncbi:MAG: rhomboid family protein [Proteobacteria bacterium]|nr:rhomboid family protein [Pseudomonadota bacterium]
MSDLSQKKCFNHGDREAVAACPECSNFFCRECIVEHDDRILCSTCLEKCVNPTKKRSFPFAALTRLGQFIFGFSIVWLMFYYVSEALLSIPSSFHEGTIWQKLGGL